MKEEQAKEMNTVNDMYSSLLKAAKNNSEMIKAVEDRKRMGDQLSDSSHILDTVAYAARRMLLWLPLSHACVVGVCSWQSNFNVAIPKKRRLVVVSNLLPRVRLPECCCDVFAARAPRSCDLHCFQRSGLAAGTN
jgi:hypothetical protein